MQMTPPTRAGVVDSTVGEEPTWVLTHQDGARLEIARTGALILSWQVPGPDGTLIELTDGYSSAEEIAELDGYRNAVLVPWSNRVRDARYTWGGVEHDLAPGQEEGREALHGMVADAAWVAVDGDGTVGDTTEPVDDDSDAPCLALVTAVVPSAGYPFPLQVRATYRLHRTDDGAHALSLDLTALNTGTEDAPVALGWHPYVRLPGHPRVDDLELRIPARTQVRTDEANIPLPGEEAFAPAPDAAGLLPIGEQALDDAWTDLEPDDDGLVRTELSSPTTGARMTLEQEPEARIVHIFTGDTLKRDRRTSVALEPCQLMTDALNRAECADELPLAPGESRSLTATLVYRA